MSLRSSGLFVAVALGAAVFGSSQSLAVPITVPTGLNPGDQYRLAFTTSGILQAAYADIANYNAYASLAANSVSQLAALGATWTAIISTESVDARDNTSTNPGVDGTGVPIFLLNDTKLADDNNDLWDGTIDLSFNIDETGATNIWVQSWTGTLSDGTAGSGAFGAMGSFAPLIGSHGDTTFGWIQLGNNMSDLLNPIYVISSTLTVVPEPSTGVLLALGVIALGAARRRERAR